MSMTGKYKTKCLIAEGGLAAWLRQMADAVERNELPCEPETADPQAQVPAAPASLDGWLGMKISLKQYPGLGLEAKLSVKFPKPAYGPVQASGLAWTEAGPAEAEDEPGEYPAGAGALPKYKSLKKHMKYTFKTIGLALTAGQMPPDAETRSFLADSRLMVAYPGKGDPYYAAYLEQTEAFEDAFEAADIEAMKKVFQNLAQLKRDCHSRYA